MSETKGREVAVLLGEVRKAIDNDRELVDEEGQGFADEDKVCVTARWNSVAAFVE